MPLNREPLRKAAAVVFRLPPRLGIARLLLEKALVRILQIAQRLLQALARRLSKKREFFFSAGSSLVPVL